MTTSIVHDDFKRVSLSLVQQVLRLSSPKHLPHPTRSRVPLSKNKHNNSMIAVLPLDSLHTFTLHLIAITSTGIIVVIWCDHEIMMAKHAVRPIPHTFVSVHPKADKFHNYTFDSKHNNHRANHNITVIKIGDCDITPSPTGRNIGVIFDPEMSMVSHVKHVCCISYYHLRNIASIRSCLTQKAAVRLVYSLVISRIDYANCLLYDLPQCLICKLQRVQNAAARLVVRCHRCEHITPVLMKRHWLPVKQRVQYSILLLVFRAQHRLAPRYITDLLEQVFKTITLHHKQWLLRSAISQPIRW